jgi:hypothetical protein
MDDNRILGIVALVISIGTTIMGIINHKRLRSKCCKRSIEVQVDIDSVQGSPRVAPLK